MSKNIELQDDIDDYSVLISYHQLMAALTISIFIASLA